MKRSRAFILSEILMGIALQAGFMLVLCTAFYLMLSFYTKTQQVLAARQKGEKVIAYVDARIRNVGLGLQKCDSSSEIRSSFCYNNKPEEHNLGKSHLALPVAIGSGDSDSGFENRAYKDDKFRGNKLTVLYTQRALPVLNLTIVTSEIGHPESEDPPVPKGTNESLDLSSGFHEFHLIAGYAYDEGNKIFKDSDFQLYHESSQHLERYAALSGTGVPVLLRDRDNKFSMKTYYTKKKVTVSPGDELLYLKCERFCVEGNNFKHQKFTDDWYDKNKHSSEEAILDIYMELDTKTHIFDLYVLASGGINSSGTTAKPEAWPQDFWKPEYEQHTIYLSRASWKLHNMERDPGHRFDWD